MGPLVKGQGEYGWTVSSVMGVRESLETVWLLIEPILANMLKMLE